MPCSYVHLSLEERRRIFRLCEAKVLVAGIAVAFGRHRSTIHRETRRNWWHDAEVSQAEGYWPLTAQDLGCCLGKPNHLSVSRPWTGTPPR